MTKEIFCPECHKLAAIVLTNDKSVKVVQNGKVLSNMPSGSVGNNVVVRCPDNHKITVTAASIVSGAVVIRQDTYPLTLPIHLQIATAPKTYTENV